jgi:hypothetical protein
MVRKRENVFENNSPDCEKVPCIRGKRDVLRRSLKLSPSESHIVKTVYQELCPSDGRSCQIAADGRRPCEIARRCHLEFPTPHTTNPLKTYQGQRRHRGGVRNPKPFTLNPKHHDEIKLFHLRGFA